VARADNDGELMKTRGRVQDAIQVAERYGGIDGGHHKQWIIDQMLRALMGEKYDEWVAEYNDYRDENGETYSDWDVGIAP
jgi:hypothetical protein